MTGWKSVSKSAPRRRRLWAAWGLATLIAVLFSLATGERSRDALFDLWQRLSPRDLTGTDVRIVMIDGESLKTVGPWPWPRYYLARLTEEIAAGGATVVGFDMLFGTFANPATFDGEVGFHEGGSRKLGAMLVGKVIA